MSLVWNTHIHTHTPLTLRTFFGQRTLPTHSFENVFGERKISYRPQVVWSLFSPSQYKKAQGVLPPPLASWPPMVEAAKRNNLLQVLIGCSNRGGPGLGHFIYLLLALLPTMFIERHCRSSSAQNQRHALPTFPFTQGRGLSMTSWLLHP